MTWIKTKDTLPSDHDIILFRDRWRNEHYGVLCGEFSEESKRGKYWCHIDQKAYNPKDVIYWCGIPINKHMLMPSLNFSGKANQFLWDEVTKIEKNILSDYMKLKLENPDWDTGNFVGIAVRNSLYRLMKLLKME